MPFHEPVFQDDRRNVLNQPALFGGIALVVVGLSFDWSRLMALTGLPADQLQNVWLRREVVTVCDSDFQAEPCRTSALPASKRHSGRRRGSSAGITSSISHRSLVPLPLGGRQPHVRLSGPAFTMAMYSSDTSDAETISIASATRTPTLGLFSRISSRLRHRGCLRYRPTTLPPDSLRTRSVTSSIGSFSMNRRPQISSARRLKKPATFCCQFETASANPR